MVERLSDYEVTVVTLREPGSEHWDRDATYRVFRAGNRPRGGRRSVIRMNLLCLLAALRRRPDVVLSMHVRAAYASAVIARVQRVRWVQYYHAREVAEFPTASAVAIRLAHVNAGPSRYTGSLLRERGVRGEMAIVPPGVGPYRSEGQTRRRNLMLTVSRLSDPHKGHDVVLRAMPAILRVLPDAKWLIAGDGPLRVAHERLARELEVEHAVEWLGAISDSERGALFATAEIFLMPSRVPDDGRGGEGFGIVYVEAAAAGLPSICANEGGATDAVKDGYSGYWVDPRDPDEIAATVVRFLEDRERVQQMSDQARQWAEQFTWERTMEAVRSALGPETSCRNDSVTPTHPTQGRR